MRNNNIHICLFIISTTVLLWGCNAEQKSETYTTDDLKQYISDYEEQVAPFEARYNAASFQADVTGNNDDYRMAASLEIALSRVHADAARFRMFSYLRDKRLVSDKYLKMQLEELYYIFLPHQVSENRRVKIIGLKNYIEQAFTQHRPLLDGKAVTESEIDNILETSKDTALLHRAWLASKDVGKIIADSLRELVVLRNQAAEKLGFNNYYEMQMLSNGQSPQHIQQIYDRLDSLMRQVYPPLKKEIDQYLSKNYHVSTDKLMPWHYQNKFFQQAPNIYQYNLNDFFGKKNVVEIARRYYKGLGLDIDEIIDHSDLRPKADKLATGYTIDIDRKGDVRILASIDSSFDAMNDIMYESGFASYYKNINPKLPYLLRRPTHYFTSDAVAIMFCRFIMHPEWLQKAAGMPPAQATTLTKNIHNQLRLEKIVFAQWAQVMYRFEKGLYENPQQDLSKLWWGLVEKYQMLKRPADATGYEWATKSHVVNQPCIYHNYMLGEMLASQLYWYININVIGAEGNQDIVWYNNSNVGKYLIEKVFRYGASISWGQLIINATGQPLDPIFFTQQFL